MSSSLHSPFVGLIPYDADSRRYFCGRDKEIDLAPPQIQSLAHLARHRTVADVIREARLRPPPVIRPEPFEENGTRVLAYPGDPRHPERTRALPGPTRLIHRAGRFEPIEGFEAFFA